MDASGYTEIATVGTDGRMVLDLATEPSDALVAVATVEPHELASSSIRIYKIGAQQPKVGPWLVLLQRCAGGPGGSRAAEAIIFRADVHGSEPVNALDRGLRNWGPDGKNGCVLTS